MAAVRSAKVFSKFGTTNFLTAKKSRPKTTSERMISTGCGTSGLSSALLGRADGSESCMHGRSFVSRWSDGQSTNARAIPMMASASASAKPRIAIDWRRLCASG